MGYEILTTACFNLWQRISLSVNMHPPYLFFASRMDMDNAPEQQSSKIAIFKSKQIRKTLHQDQWYFSIIDIIAVLTESPNPRRYWSNLKIQLSENEGFAQLYSKTVQ